MITLTTCFEKLIDLNKQKKLVSDRLNWSNGHPYFLLRLGELEYDIDWYQGEIYNQRQIFN